MKNEIDIHRALRVFNKVTQYGEKTSDTAESVYHLCGINALTGFDGYTITLSDVQVKLDIFFHNKYQFDYPNNEALDNFLKRFSDVEKFTRD
ncbi:DUF3081 family protein [Shewanella sp. HL-SH8]|uniref:DUF3081 family protein n=1 Tax=unclassified Shewanella TaxID=196818 RepID=UPI003EBB4266